MDASNDTVWSEVQAFFLTQGINLVIGIVLLVVGWWVVRMLHRLFLRWLAKSDRIDPMLETFFASLLYYGLLALLLIISLNLMGVQTTSLIAILGAASLAIGLALQGSLTALAAGVMLIILRPIRIGDYIEVSGEAGSVKSITLFYTELATYDNIQKLLPNSEVWGNTITNYSVYNTRMIDIEVGIDYGDSIEDALAVLRRIADEEDKVLPEPAPAAFVTAIGDSSVDLTLRLWVAASDYWPVRRALTRRVKEEIEGAGLSIPFPHRQLVLPPGEKFPVGDPSTDTSPPPARRRSSGGKQSPAKAAKSA